MAAAGQAPIVMKRELDGFVMNRMQGALLEEAFRLVADGYASVEDVDIGLREGLALRWSFMGPFETIDLNAPDGIRDYVQRYQSIYSRLFPSMQRRVDWAGPVLETAEGERRRLLVRASLQDRQRWRDRRLMALAAHKRRADRDVGDRCMASKRKVIITCAVTGSIHTPTMTPHLPITAQEIADAAIGAAEAGAAIVHLHARDPKDGRPDQSPAAFEPFLKVIKQRSNCIVNITTGGAATMTIEERVRPAATFKPEVASLNMGTMNFGLYPMLERYDALARVPWPELNAANITMLLFWIG